MHDANPTRSGNDLADMVEMLLDKGVVINADIAVSVGDTQLLGIEVRAAIASFETAAKYGLEFPAGTDKELLEEAASGRTSLDANEGSNSTDDGHRATHRGKSETPTPEIASRVATDPVVSGNTSDPDNRGETDVEAESDTQDADAKPDNNQEEIDEHDDN